MTVFLIVFAVEDNLVKEAPWFGSTGLTTFSTFSAETVHLLQRQHYGWAFSTIALNLLGSLSTTGLGLLTARALRAGLD